MLFATPVTHIFSAYRATYRNAAIRSVVDPFQNAQVPRVLDVRDTLMRVYGAASGDMRVQQPKVMVITTQRWPLAARIALALAKTGFLVAVISPSGSLARRTKAIHAHYQYQHWLGSSSIINAINHWSPHFLVCADEPAVGQLHSIHHNFVHAMGHSRSDQVVDLIEVSLGDPASYALAQKPSAFILSAQSIGIRCPRTVVIPDNNALDRELRNIAYPILVKGDGSWGGRCIRIAESDEEVRAAISELRFPINWPRMVRRFFGKSNLLSSLSWLHRKQSTFVLQECIVGRPANRAVVCWRGVVLAGISVQAIETMYEFGPGSVIQVIEHPEMTASAEALVQRLKLSGFIGFDFMLDAHNRAWLIEMNPRATPVAHLCAADGTNLPAALFSRVTETNVSHQTCVQEKTIALFPQELMRSRQSEYLSSCYHDVPWDEPELVFACLKSMLRPGRLKRSGWVRRDRQVRTLHGGLQQPGTDITHNHLRESMTNTKSLNM